MNKFTIEKMGHDESHAIVSDSSAKKPTVYLGNLMVEDTGVFNIESGKEKVELSNVILDIFSTSNDVLVEMVVHEKGICGEKVRCYRERITMEECHFLVSFMKGEILLNKFRFAESKLKKREKEKKIAFFFSRVFSLEPNRGSMTTNDDVRPYVVAMVPSGDENSPSPWLVLNHIRPLRPDPSAY